MRCHGAKQFGLSKDFSKLMPSVHCDPTRRSLPRGGVAVSHAEIIRHTAGRPVVIGFDQDYHSNETVCLQLARLIAGRIANEGTAVTTRIATWQANAKGIDDAALMGLPIEEVSCVDWLHSLPSPFRQQVIAAWRSQRIPRERELR